MNAIVAVTAESTFRAEAASTMERYAKTSLHELVDEFQTLTDGIEATVQDGVDGRRLMSDEGQVLLRRRRLLAGSVRARFGLDLRSFDRRDAVDYDDLF